MNIHREIKGEVMAQIGWIDFSPEHRERVSAVLDLLKPEGVVDELGIGSIRDAFADKMFPGISTIQTKAKYFFIVPYILYEYQLLSLARQKSKTPEKHLEEREYEVMWELAERYEHKVGCGVIGITKYKPEKIMRRPSAIYWHGLDVFGVILHGGLGVNSFLRSRMERAETLTSDIAQGDDAPHDDADVDYINRFNLKIPFDKDWADNLTLDLTPEEANILYHRIREAGKELLIGVLLEEKELFANFEKTESFADFAKIASSGNKLNQHIREMLTLAHDFSELMYGAHITYNCLLQENKFNNSAYSDEWSEWVENIGSNMIDYNRFNPDKVFEHVHRVRRHTRQFVYDWWNYINASSHPISKRNELTEVQEFNTKLVKARIRQNKYDDIKEKTWIGLTKLEYRMPNAKIILQDIFDGLRMA